LAQLWLLLAEGMPHCFV